MIAMKWKTLIAATVLAWCGFGPQGSAAGLILDSSGQLQGATHVVVGADLYDVEFLDTSCILAFSGCDNAVEDFAFTTVAQATSAAQALLDQVLLDGPDGLFDTDPELANGCSDVRICLFYVPHGFNSSGSVSNRIAYNYAVPGAADLVGIGVIGPGGSMSAVDNSVYARFTLAPIPEPATLGLFVTAVAGLFSARRVGLT